MGIMKALICGGRDYRDAAHMLSVLRQFPITEIIHGGARGADTLADVYAREAGIPVTVFPADWKGDGAAAGFIRNGRMLAEGKPDIMIAFPGGGGTADMVKRAWKAGVRVVAL